MTGYTKLFGSIVDSSIWFEPNTTRIIWITMLALANRDGVVEASIPGLASRAVVSVQECEKAIETLSSPDKYSKNPANEGRRIERVKEGWKLINYDDYRHRLSEEDAREKAAIRQARFKERRKLVTLGNAQVTLGNAGNDIAEAEAEAEACTHMPSAVHDADASKAEPELIPVPLPVKDPKRLAALALLQEVFDTWNDQNVLPRCLLVSDKRKRFLLKRLDEPFFASNWRSALKRIQASNFCRGGGNTGWRASLDWFIQPDSVAKIMEGKYDNVKISTPTKPAPDYSKGL